MEAALNALPTVDSCGAEPIHTPASIQPHGITLIVEMATGLVRHGAGAVERRLGVTDWQDRKLAELLGAAVAARVLGLCSGSGLDMPLAGGGGLLQALPDLFVGRALGAGGYMGRFMPADAAACGLMDVSAHAAPPWIVVDLEDIEEGASSVPFVFDKLEDAHAAFDHAGSLTALCSVAAVAFSNLTSFDRVMIYRFGPDAAGQVLAECLLPASDGAGEQLPSFMHHHFPASDIPIQARALYLRNTLRVIPNVAYHPAVLRPAWSAEAPLDMSDCSLRSVSPIHLEYLSNMGVGASCSFSIIRDGALWGLVACHHRTHRGLGYNVRSACRLLVGSLARQIGVQEQASGLRERLRLRAFEDEIVTALSREGALEAGMSRQLADSGRMMYGDGAAVVHGDTLVTSGACPSDPEIRDLIAWLPVREGESAYAAGSADPVFATDHLARMYPPAAAFQAVCSGLMSIVLSADLPWVLLWFRAEQVQVVTWAGNPHKDIVPDPTLTLRPRASFAAWHQIVQGRSEPWSKPKRDAAAHLRVALLNTQQVIRERDLNRHLARALQDKDLLLQQNEFLIGEVNHRVQNSLQLVGSFLSLQARSSTNAEMNDALDEARRRLSAVALVHRRLYRGDQLQHVDAARYIEDLCADTVDFMGKDWAPHLSMKLAPAKISTDRAVSLGLVLTELMINCNKHAYAGAAGPIVIELTEDGTNLRMVVADQGVGRRADDEQRKERGYGSRIMVGLIRQLGGKLSHADNKPGLRTCVTIPMDKAIG